MLKKLMFFMQATALVGLLASCVKEDLAVSIDQSGVLTVQLLDTAGNAIPNNEVLLFSIVENSSRELGKVTGIVGESPDTDGNLINKQMTDEDGKIDFGRYTEGDYVLFTDYLQGGDYYWIQQPIQVLAGDDGVKKIALKDYRQDVILTVLDGNTKRAIPNFEILLVSVSDPVDEEVDGYDQKRRQLASAVGKTNQAGRVVLNVPIGEYNVYYTEPGSGDLDRWGYYEIGRDRPEYITLLWD